MEESKHAMEEVVRWQKRKDFYYHRAMAIRSQALKLQEAMAAVEPPVRDQTESSSVIEAQQVQTKEVDFRQFVKLNEMNVANESVLNGCNTLDVDGESSVCLAKRPPELAVLCGESKEGSECGSTHSGRAFVNHGVHLLNDIEERPSLWDEKKQKLHHQTADTTCASARSNGSAADSELAMCVMESNNQECRPPGKVSFCLSWGGYAALQGHSESKQKYDVVSCKGGDISTRRRSSKEIHLFWEDTPRVVLVIVKPKAENAQALCSMLVQWLVQEREVTVVVENRVREELMETNAADHTHVIGLSEGEEERVQVMKKVDLVVTLGGDGTVLWAASLFYGPMPPLVAFACGSLGFMTPFPSDNLLDQLDHVLCGPVHLTLRSRLVGRIVRNHDNKSQAAEEQPQQVMVERLVLNEVVIERGMESMIVSLDCFCGDIFVTRVSGDGLILSTPSGSTAYSLAAGGSIIHPHVPGILLTPICPHSLSFRPLILPDNVVLRVEHSAASRGRAWVSFDGRARQPLNTGEVLLVESSPWPVPMACQGDTTTSDFFKGVREGLHWNMRDMKL